MNLSRLMESTPAFISLNSQHGLDCSNPPSDGQRSELQWMSDEWPSAAGERMCPHLVATVERRGQ